MSYVSLQSLYLHLGTWYVNEISCKMLLPQHAPMAWVYLIDTNKFHNTYVRQSIIVQLVIVLDALLRRLDFWPFFYSSCISMVFCDIFFFLSTLCHNLRVFYYSEDWQTRWFISIFWDMIMQARLFKWQW